MAVLLAACAAPPPGTEAPVQTGPAWFEDVAATAGPVFEYVSGHRERHLFPEIMGGGVALFDLEGDGDLDIYFVQGGSLHEDGERPGNRLWLNTGDGLVFEDVSEGSGAADTGYGMGVAAGDVDGDGDVDLYVTNVGANVLLLNDSAGDGVRFADVTESAGVGDTGWGTSAAFLDVDGDGDLDLYVVNYVVWSRGGDLECFSRSGQPDYCSPVSFNAPQPDVLYRNDGLGADGVPRFTDVSIEAGLRTAFGNGLGLVWGDFDGDGRYDVFVANDQIENQFWHNRSGEAGGFKASIFKDLAMEVGCAVDENGRAKAGMGTVAGDLDDDGDLDLLVVNLQAQSDSFFRNQGAYFLDDTPRVGLGSVSRPYTRFGVGWIDFDNDGWPDVYQANGRVTLPEQVAADRATDPFAEVNVLLRGTSSGRFEEVAPAGGTAEALAATSRAAAFGDLDDDGGVDVVVVNRDATAHLLRNVAPGRGHWVRFRVLDRQGSDALGAALTLKIGERTVRRDVRVAYSYCASNDPRVHVGLGDETVARDVRVTWPDGRVEELGDFEVDRDHVIRPSH
ncbi:MAG: FG-GAP-like repeat-containing protein [Thermoanaerobaculia bacterium]